MFHVYETLTSDVTSDFSGNTASKFKVKTGMKLPGLNWKVSIVSAVLPKMALFKELQTKTDPLITLYGKSVKHGGPDTWIKGDFKGSDVQALEKSEMSTTAEDFFNCVMQIVGERAHASLDTGFEFSKEWVQLAWDKTRAQPEIILESSNRKNLLYVEKTFAKLMGRTKTDGSGTISLGTNMVPDYTTYAEGVSLLGNGKAMKVSFGKWIQLNALSNWRFMNLHQSFKEALNLHARPLIVAAKVKSGGATMTQPLGRVYYAPQGRERYLFTPPWKKCII